MSDSIDSVKAFYDAMAADYHLIFADWEQSIMWQGQIIDRMIRAMLTPRPEPVRVLDCACGIGTQAIGLVKQGNGRYQVHATDI
ncbi:MAG TPA: hypothetical protein VHL11_22895, partial [Phototrophicaceae bacterium]|nr:hypothetical protein [Phototrophicaceae bacterium]